MFFGIHFIKVANSNGLNEKSQILSIIAENFTYEKLVKN